MKKLILLLAIIVSFTACKDEKKDGITIGDYEENNMDSSADDASENKSDSDMDDDKKVSSEVKEYPVAVRNVMNAHGSLERWKTMNNLCFEMKGKDGAEIHTVSLPDRKSKIENKDWTIGYDGNKVWLLQNKVGYKGNPTFYNNLMFYFYAMPFVLSDPGTIYTAVEPTELDGKVYNGFKVSYNDGVGVSSKDEYILYFDPETNLMTWLAYTVTFKDQKKSDDFHYIKYDKWEDVNGLQLPKKITWWNVENGKPHDEKSDMKFDKITLTETRLENSVFEKPAEAEYVN